MVAERIAQMIEEFAASVRGGKYGSLNDVDVDELMGDMEEELLPDIGQVAFEAE